MSYYHFKLTPPRPTFSQDMTPEEREVMNSHVGYWSSLADKGTALIVGPVADPAGVWGVAIVEAADQDEVRTIKENDPVSKSGLPFQYDTLPMLRVILRK